MGNYEDNVVELFNYEYKLDRAKDEILDELKKETVENVLNLGVSLFKIPGSAVTEGTPIPAIISSLINSYKTLKGATNYYNLKKHLELFVRVSEISTKERAQFIKGLNENIDFREQFCATVSLVIERVTELEKVKVISNLIIARAKFDVNDETFFRMMHIVDKLSWYDLYCIYLTQCSSTEMDKVDKRKVGSIDGQYVELLMETNGLMSIERNIKDIPNRGFNHTKGGRGEKPSPTKNLSLSKKSELTTFGKRFLICAFRGFKYDIRKVLEEYVRIH